MSTATDSNVMLSFDPKAVNKQADIIGPATSTKAGVMTAAQVQQLDSASVQVAVDDVFIYADAVNGNDKNKGTKNKPVKTFTRAQELIPASWKKNMQIILAPGTYDASGVLPPAGGPPKWGSAVGPAAVFPVVVGAYTNELGVRTVTAGSNGDTITDNTLVLTTDQYRGAFIFCVTGANAGARRIIDSNTVGGQFNLGKLFDNPISPGDKFEVQRCAVTLNIHELFFMSGAAVLWQGIKFDLVDSGAIGSFHDGQWLSNGCEFALNGGAIVCELPGTFSMTGFAPPFGSENPLNVLSPTLGDPGSYIHDGALLVLGLPAQSEIRAVMDNMFIGVELATISFDIVRARDTVVVADTDSSSVFVFNDDNGLVQLRSLFDGNPSFGGPIFTIFGTGYLQAFGTDIQNSLGDAIFVGARGTAQVFDVGGAGNAGFGINAQSQAAVFYNSAGSGAPTTVTGASGDVQVAANPPLTYAAIDAGPGFTDPVALIRIEPQA